MSSAVRAIQTQLKEAGFYKGEIDGLAGPLTVAAVKAATEQKQCTPEQVEVVTEQNKSDPDIVGVPQTSTTEVAPKFESGFKFGSASETAIKGIKPQLEAVVRLALRRSRQDFRVLEGLRTVSRQAQLVRQGASQTMNSKHITGDAVDLVPIVDGKVSWNWQYYYEIARAMQEAAIELGVRIKWGGAWEVLNDNRIPPARLMERYAEARKRAGKKAFTDGPHYELA